MRPLYLLIEEVNREFLSRLLIAREAAALGHPVLIGQQWWMAGNFKSLPPGVALFKGNNRIQANFMRQAKQAGHRVASIDEEAFVSSSATEISAQYDPTVEPECDLFIVQGAFQGDVIRAKFPGAADRVFLAGNPRADLLRDPMFRPDDPIATAYREKAGRFLLVNTNFTTINPKYGDVYSYFQICGRVGVLDDPDMLPVDRFLQWCDWERANLRAMVEVIRDLADARPDIPIVLRPHPSERRETWERAFAGVAGVDVIAEGDHLAWIVESELLLHSGCSTGLEAYLLGRDAISLTPGDSVWLTPTISNIVNPVETDPAAAVARVLGYLDGDGLPDPDSHAIEHYLFDDAGLPPAVRIARVLSEMARKMGQAGADQMVAHLKSLPSSKRMMGKAAISLEEVRRRLREVEAATHRDTEVAVKEIAPAVFQFSMEHALAEAR